MPLTLMQSLAIDEIVLLLVDWLPGSSPWGTYTFADAAAENHVGDFWPGGSKKRALTELLQRTYEARRDRFCPLVLTIVQRGLSYRRQKGSPIQRPDVEQLNTIVARLSFKIPELWDRTFLQSLPAGEPEQPTEPEPPRPVPTPDPRSAMPALYDRFMALHSEPDRAKAGREFEPLLDDLFAAWELAPSRSYRVTGEEIDNSFVLDGDTYLLEAKWIGGAYRSAASVRLPPKGQQQVCLYAWAFLGGGGLYAWGRQCPRHGPRAPNHPARRRTSDARPHRRSRPARRAESLGPTPRTVRRTAVAI